MSSWFHFVNKLFFLAPAISLGSYAVDTCNKTSSYIEASNSVKVLPWHLWSLIFCNVVIPTNMMDCILGTMIVFSGGKASPDELIPAPCWVLCINHEVSIILMQMRRSPIRQRAQSPGNNVMGYWAFEIYSLAKFSKAKQIWDAFLLLKTGVQLSS